MIPFWRKKHQEKEAFVLKNGEILLEQLITTFDGKRNPIRNFSSEELKLATNNYNTMNFIRDDCFFKLYKGFLLDGQIPVTVFESKGWQLSNDCINDIVFASQMCHKHILKLIGYCLETEAPILVFESLVKYGTLEDHIANHHKCHLETLSWRQRLKIAMEISHTFAYLHVGFPRPIVYSLMSSSKFLLDEHFVPKLFDFSRAECIPEGETQIKDALVRGTFGYIAPELVDGVLDEKCDPLKKGVLDEKGDVYGFGSLLLELLTGQRIVDSSRPQGTYNLFDYLEKKLYEDNWFIETVDPIIVGDGLCPEIEQQLKVFKELAVKCHSYSGEDRPTMIDAAKQLRQLYLSIS